MKVKGKYGEATILTNKVEQTALDQVENLMNQKWVEDTNVIFMPDIHAGAYTPIGLTIRTKKKQISPELIGSDIGCGIMFVETNYKIKNEKDLSEKLDTIIREKVPTLYFDKPDGELTKESKEILLKGLTKELEKEIDFNEINKYFGTLGGGNHFIEAYNYNGNLALAVHSGSRTMGGIAYNYYKKLAKKENNNYEKQSVKLIKKLKKENKQEHIQEELIKLKAKLNKEEDEQDPNLLLLKGKSFDKYLKDIKIISSFASSNRFEMISSILFSLLDIEKSSQRLAIEITDKTHNYIEKIIEKEYIIRKGAQSAYMGERVIIPINMRDGIILSSIDLNYPQINFSFPHGAGRVMSRTQARNTIKLDDFVKQMKDVNTTSVGIGTIDEAPDAYKQKEEILKAIKNYSEPEPVILKPFYNYKEE